MSSQAFQSIIARLQQGQISADEARQLLQQLKARTQASATAPAHEDIAVIGMSGQFPGAENVERFWHNLSTGADGVVELGERYLDLQRSYSAERQPGKTYCKWGGILEQRDDFDPLFFNISPRDAESMNPHQRLILQESWKALEDAGYNPKSFRDQAVGIFVGAEPSGYFHETFIGASDALIASRLSYFLDFKGPALVVNTGCSSSATAIHLACESLRNQEADLALAGGVFATLGEPGLISLAQMDMLSPSGRCHTFDQRSDGIVLSEAVGMLALKRLSRALADGDPIHGVICASGMNQDGASNGITAPSGQAQERLISELYRRFAIDPRQISYVEAHGTGTPLGDPVEVNALVRAFRQFTGDTGFCALGSAKAHIGHTSAAAGVVSLIKILLSMKHGQLPGLLNFEQLNPRIELAGSAFHIHREPRAWLASAPKMAALNSFGHSGTNVHMVIRQAPDPVATALDDAAQPCLVPLSARTAESLKRYARRVRQALLDPALRLKDLAYTLQTGRMAQAQRLIFLCADKDQLRHLLNDWLDGRSSRHCWAGQAEAGPGAQIALPTSVDQDSLQSLAVAWAAGGTLDWAGLHRQHPGDARRVHVPVYPFARQNFWIAPAQRGAAGGAASSASAADPRPLHPFLGRDTSDSRCQRFSSVFDGEEFFLKQHVVGGQRIFPGVAHLEMARAAVAMATGGHSASFTQVVWLRPLIIGARPRQVDIELIRDEDAQLRFEISSRELDPLSGQATGEPLLHSQGLVGLALSPQPPQVDLAALKARMNGGQLSARQCYDAYRVMTFEHGPAYQGLQSVALGHGEVLAQLQVPDCQRDSLADYVLHPALMDSALQAAIALSLGAEVVLSEDERQHLPSLARPTLPFALEGLQVLERCSERMWARVSYAERRADQQADSGLQRLNIELLDQHGTPCVVMQGFTSRVLNPVDAPADNASEPPQTLLFQPRWLEQAAPVGAPADVGQRLILLSGFDPQIAAQAQQQLTAQDPRCRCTVLEPVEADCAADYQQLALLLLQHIRPLLAGSGRRLLQLAVHDPAGDRLVGGLAAMLRSLQLELPEVTGQVLELDDQQALVQRLTENAAAAEVGIRYRDGRRQVQHWQPCPPVDLAIDAPWKDRGVYLITGGLGGLGRLFAQAIAASVSGATLILTGRSPLAAHSLAGLDPGRNRIEYRQLDVSDAPAVQRLIDAIVAEYRSLDGVLHSAGVIRDSLLINKQDDELRQVMAAKVAGTCNLDRATAGLALDFWIGFSSGTGVVGNVGQADYAAANGFIDRYAAYRQQLTARGLRRGLSLAINWPLWKDGGMQVDAATAQHMADSAGLQAMPSNAGIHALRQCVALALPQVLVMHGQPEPISALVTGAPRASLAPVAAASPAAPLTDTLLRALTELVSAQMKIPAGDIRADVEFSQYGFDSISLTTLANTLKQQWRLSLAPTIFFEHATLGRFAAYLQREHSAALAARFAVPTATPTAPPRPQSAQAAPRPQPDATLARPTAPATLEDDEIAVIGISGRFPMAEDIQQFFHNLKDGRDCISEIPANRWDWREYYGDPHREVDKTNVKWGGFIHGVDHFDPLFFAISPREAQLMDPQQRLLMTYVWLAIEDAGYAPSELAGSDTGIFVGTGVTGYSSLIAKAGVPVEGYSATAMVPSVGPNRMSFLLDFHGPSEPVETACSSSLVAIHRAVQAMRSGDCAMAVVGGVNTLIAPEAQISFSKAGMLALDGRSKTFSAQANGYARGEGVAMIVLKKRAQAEADGDHIYALVRSTAENHGGKANSLTAPNPRAQAELLKAAYRKAGVDPRSVGYIEAHGTGTALGDPIEINGLKMAFAELSQELGGAAPGQGYCGVGSVKSNMGHLELAAGIAGVVKVLLQLKHQTLFKSLHCEQLNPYIELADSPFYVVQHTGPWAAIKDPQGNELPRRAGVSSFGFGGANAHVLLEEYRAPQAPQTPVTPGARAFLLSARTPEQLQESARRLAGHLAAAPLAHGPEAQRYLDELAYTLQVGREAMQERLALLSDSPGDLQRQLEAFATSGEALYRGTCEGDNPVLALFRQDEDMATVLAAWIEQRKYPKLLELWARGLNIEWRRFYPVERPMRRLSLPGYPFAEERYWVTDLAAAPPASQGPAAAWLHPLLERNTSDLHQQRFSSRWQGDESWFADHRVKGQGTLPGVAYLEMARAAIARALPGQAADSALLQLRNIVWLTPYTPTAPHGELHIDLSLQASQVDFRIYSRAEGVELEHCKGSARAGAASAVAALDLATLCAGPWQRSVDAAELYARFQALGIDYGPGHRGVSQLWLGEGRVLARLELAPERLEGDWVLHPGMLDCAVQASIGLLLQREATGDTLLPFALEQLNIHGRCQPSMWALISLDSRYPGSAVQRIDIQVCDAQGQVAVALHGFSSRPLREGRAAPLLAGNDQRLPAGLSLLAAQWLIAERSSRTLEDVPTLAIGASGKYRQWLAGLYPQIEFIEPLAGSVPGIAAQLDACAAFQRLIWLAPAEHASLTLLRLIKALLQRDLGQQPLQLQLLFNASVALRADEPLDPEQAACHGLAGALAKEQALWRVELLDLPPGAPALPQALPEPELAGECLAWRDGEWFCQRLLPLAEPGPAAPGAVAYREGGVYVVIGGAGGIGQVWTRHLIRHWRAQVVWLGRRAADERIDQALAELASLARQYHAAPPRYIQADATDIGQLTRARQQVQEACGPINGWVHSALVLDDGRLAQLDEARFSAVFDAKRLSSIALAQVCAAADNPALDFVLFFSSMIAFSRAAGQGNYAAGCAFADALAATLDQRTGCPVKVINWGYWGSVGVVADPGYRARMAAQGLGSIEPEEGMAALDRLLASPLPQLGLIKLREPQAIAGIHSQWQLDCYPAQPSLARDSWAPVVQGAGAAPAQHPAAGEMNRLLLAQTLACLGELAAGGPLTEQRIAADPAVAANLLARPFYRRWLRASLELLVQSADIDEQGRVLSALPDPAALSQQWQQASEEWRRDADLQAQVQLLQTFVQALPSILRGEQSATAVMFPNGSMALVEGVYKNNRVSDYFNAVLGEVVVDVARRQAQNGRPLRILEIGAGTGGTTAGLIESLRPWQQGIAEYCYTDLSQAFLQHAQTQFLPLAPYLRTAIFDVGKPCAEQGIALQHYDLVIATNVLHATPDLRRALQNAKTALRHGGLLLLNEISDRSLFTHLTFGLLEGWWLHHDTALRIPGCPGLYPERWRQLLQAQGFDGIAFPAAASHSLGQQIIVAASDGVVCLPGRASEEPTALEAQAPVPVAQAEGTDEGADQLLAGQCRQLIIEVLSKLLNMAPERLQHDTAFDRYGIDSILQISLIQALEQRIGELSRTILFEHNTVNQLTGYLLAEHRAALVGHFAPVQAQPPVAPAPVVMPAAAGPDPVMPAASHSARVEAQPQPLNRDIAIIGVNGRYPMAADLERFWDNLRSGRNCVTQADGQRWSGALKENADYYGGFLEQVEAFDHQVFGISDDEARHFSPELRQMLEVAWLTFESAGYNRDALARFQQDATSAIGVFIGSMYNASSLRDSAGEHAAIRANVTDWQLPNRISHCFDLKGPSLAVNTACASSMSAIHLACQSLLQGECAMAMAGGVNLILDPSRYQTLKLAQFLGSSPLSRGFGLSDGMLPGEGAGAVLLKPLAAALADGDRIHGVIKSTGLNHGGGQLQYSAPNTRQQARLIAETIQRAGLLPAQIHYVEAAANGSELGDPIEVAALKKVFAELPPGSCALGTVKSNIGHLEAASGISQLTKVLLQLQHRQLAPSINAEPLNPHIRLDGSAFHLQQQAAPWAADDSGQPRRCLINSFGAGGTYASLVLEEYQDTRPRLRGSAGEQLLIVAAASRGSLLAYLKKLQAFIDRNCPIDLSDLAYSLALREQRLAHRAALVATDREQVRARLAQLLTGVAGDGCWLSAPTGIEEIAPQIASGSLAQRGQAWCRGADLQSSTLYPQGGNRMTLPGYEFEHPLTPPKSGSTSSALFSSELYRRISGGELDVGQFAQLLTRSTNEQGML